MENKGENDKEYSFLSYDVFLNDIMNFRKSGTKNGDEFNLYDTPSNKYFRLFFYFWNDTAEVDDILKSGGLLAPTWELMDSNDNTEETNNVAKEGDNTNNSNENAKKTGLSVKDLWQYNSAYSYLKINNEEERAEKLKQFVTLLSNINTNSPWYFNAIEGLGEALDRKQTMEENFQFDNSRKKISIKCLPDAYDDRIGTLLDLYKDIVWSWQMKREIIPSNLRKFDMGIYIFESPITNIHKNIETEEYATVDKLNKSKYLTSYKYIEFHNCEIDYNSSRTGLQALSNNAEGVHPEYTIDIFFDDCYESRYNEFMLREIGDMVAIDSAYVVYDNSLNKDIAIGDMSVKSEAQKDDVSRREELYNRSNIYEMSVKSEAQKDDVSRREELYNRSNIYEMSTFTDSVVNELVGAGKSLVGSIAKRIALGNLHGISLSKISDQVDAALDGHLWTSVQSAQQYVANQKQAQTQYVKEIGNFFKAKSAINNL